MLALVEALVLADVLALVEALVLAEVLALVEALVLVSLMFSNISLILKPIILRMFYLHVTASLYKIKFDGLRSSIFFISCIHFDSITCSLYSSAII